MPVQLSRKGLALVDRALEAHVANEHRLLAALPASMVAELDANLSLLLSTLETGSGDAPSRTQDEA